MTKLFSFLNRLINNNKFLKILSVVLAVITWLFITNVASPVNEKVIPKVPVEILYEGSTADKNGLIMLMNGSDLTVSVTVEGPRSNLQMMTEDKIRVQVNLDTVGTPGTYQLPLTTSLSDSKISVKEMSISILPIEFAKKASVELPVTVQTIGEPSSEHEYTGAECTPQSITITGPENTLSNIEKAVINADITDSSSSFDISTDIRLYNQDGTETTPTYLTVSDETVQAHIKIEKTKIVPVTADILNRNGCTEKAYTAVACTPSSIKIFGSDDAVDHIENIALEPIDITQINTDEYSTRKALPNLENITYESAEPVTLNLTFLSIQTKTLQYTAGDMDQFRFINAGDAAPSIASSTLTFYVRGAADTIDQITKETFTPTVDMADRNAQGQYRVYFYNATDLNAGVIGDYYIWVNRR